MCIFSTREPSEYTFDLQISGGNKISVDIGDGLSIWDGNLAYTYYYPVNKWMHIAATVDAVNYICTVYVNGVSIGAQNFATFGVPALYEVSST